MTDRIEVQRTVPTDPSTIFAVLTDPQGHVAIDSAGMLQDADGERVTQAGDQFVVHMDREALGDIDLGRYDVTITITTFEQDREIAWRVGSAFIDPPLEHVYGYRLEPAEGGGTVLTSYYDWSQVREEWRAVFPVIGEAALKGTLGILDRTARRGYAQASPR